MDLIAAPYPVSGFESGALPLRYTAIKAYVFFLLLFLCWLDSIE